MNSFKLFTRAFFRDEDGAVTVDWVVLTSAVVALATVIYIGISDESRRLAAAIATEIANSNPF